MIRKGKKQIKKDKYAGKLRWKKISGGIHNHRDGQVVRKGEVLYANELGSVLAKGFECLDSPKGILSGVSLGIKSLGNGWFDVINKATGEKLNDTSLRARDAKMFITGEIEEAIEEEEDSGVESELEWSDLLDMNEEELQVINNGDELDIEDDEWETEDDFRVLIANLLKIDIVVED